MSWLLSISLLLMALMFMCDQFENLPEWVEYYTARRKEIKRLERQAKAWEFIAQSAQSSLSKAYALAKIYNATHEKEYIKINTTWWEVDYETLFNKKRV